MKKRILLLMLITLFFIAFNTNVYAEEPIPQTGTEQVTTMPNGNNGEATPQTDGNGEMNQPVTENGESNSPTEENIVMATGEVEEEAEEESSWVTTPSKNQIIYLVSVGIFVIGAYIFGLIVIFKKIKEVVVAYKEDKKVGE